MLREGAPSQPANTPIAGAADHNRIAGGKRLSASRRQGDLVATFMERAVSLVYSSPAVPPLGEGPASGRSPPQTGEAHAIFEYCNVLAADRESLE